MIGDNLQRASSSWEQILHTFGGAFELAKYALYLITWEFTESRLLYFNKKTTHKTIQNHASNNIISRTIQQLQTINKFKYLGVTSALDGNPRHQFQVILQNAKKGSIMISSNPFNHHQAVLYFISRLLPN